MQILSKEKQRRIIGGDQTSQSRVLSITGDNIANISTVGSKPG